MQVCGAWAFSSPLNKNAQLNFRLRASDGSIEIDRRDVLKAISHVSMASALLTQPTTSAANAIDFPFASNDQRRQLELCLVTILRVRYWSETVAQSIQQKINDAPPSGLTDAMKKPYLEARLGAKGLLTGKVGGGATARVYTLATLQLRGCVKDAEYWFNDRYKMEMKANIIKTEEKATLKQTKLAVGSSAVDIIESLASLVEFDGLDNVQDPSPRSTLALSQYTNTKALFIKRILLERTIPACEVLLNAFGREKRQAIERYVASTYPSEIPASKSSTMNV